MDMYVNYEKIRNERGLNNSQVANLTGISKSVFSEWKSGRFTPRIDKIQKIAEVLDVPIDFIVTGDSPNYGYFLEPEVAEMAQVLHDDHNLRIIFDATRKASKEDMDWLMKTLTKMGWIDD